MYEHQGKRIIALQRFLDPSTGTLEPCENFVLVFGDIDVMFHNAQVLGCEGGRYLRGREGEDVRDFPVSKVLLGQH
jgi:hypothetical protein